MPPPSPPAGSGPPGHKGPQGTFVPSARPANAGADSLYTATYPVVYGAAETPAGPPVYPLHHPAGALGRLQRPLPARGRTASLRGTITQFGPPVRIWHAPVRAPIPVAPRGGSASWRVGLPQGTGAPVRQWDGPVQARIPQPPPARGRVSSRAGVFTSTGVTSGPPVYPLGHPVQARRLPQRGGTTHTRTGTYAQTGPPVRIWTSPIQARQPLPPHGRVAGRAGAFGQAGPPVKVWTAPIQARQPLPPHGRTVSRAGTFTPQAGPPVRIWHAPIQARPPLPPRGRVVRAAGTYAGTGPPAIPLRQPVGVYRKQLPPPTRGRVASQRGPYAQAGPPVVRLRRPVRGQPQKPLLTGRAAWRAGTYTVPLVAPFTVGALTASTAATATQTPGDRAAGVLTASTAAAGALTAGD